MTQNDDTAAAPSGASQSATVKRTMPVVRPVGFDDIRSALVAGLSDFARAPLFGLFFGGLYAAGGIFIVFAATRLHMPWMIYPLAIGFPLIGPFVAVGLYDVSRKLEAGRPLVWREVLTVVLAQRKRELSWMAFVMLFVLWIWMYQIRLLLALFLGFKSFLSFDAFVHILVATPEGLAFLAVGHVVGAFLALALYSITVVSVPLLLERNIDFVTAMITSVSAVFTSPVPMLAWGVVVTLLLIAACIPFFLGLLIVLPVLGHATWHLYRRIVAPPAAG